MTLKTGVMAAENSALPSSAYERSDAQLNISL